MPARWDLFCQSCDDLSMDVECSMYSIPPCSCGGERTLYKGTMASKSSIFPFEARHVAPDGKPIIIESMRHLRQIEKSHGVVFSAFNNELNNSCDPTKGDLPRYRGGDEDFKRDHRY